MKNLKPIGKVMGVLLIVTLVATTLSFGDFGNQS